MKVIQCPKCKNDIKLDISKTIDENGEIYQCPTCGFIFT